MYKACCLQYCRFSFDVGTRKSKHFDVATGLCVCVCVCVCDQWLLTNVHLVEYNGYVRLLFNPIIECGLRSNYHAYKQVIILIAYNDYMYSDPVPNYQI